MIRTGNYDACKTMHPAHARLENKEIEGETAKKSAFRVTVQVEISINGSSLRRVDFIILGDIFSGS